MQESSRIARRLSALVDLGFERADVAPTSTETIRVDRKTQRVTSVTPAMGTLVSVSTLVRSSDRAKEAIGRAFEEMYRLIGVFSRFEGSSALSNLNENGKLDGAPHELCTVIEHALRHYRLSRGAFDVTVEPVVDLFRERMDREQPKVPTRQEIGEALELVGSEHIALSERRIRFEKSGMGVTLDGIAKGFIVDAMARELDKHAVKHYLINAGGDIRSRGTREDMQPWTVAVQDPAKRGPFPDIIHLTDGAVATSGSYEIYFDRDRLFHHIVDAESGTSRNRNVSVSVVAPRAMAADALATSVFVLEPRIGVALIDSMAGCECLIIDNNGSQVKSAGWPGAAPFAENEARS